MGCPWRITYAVMILATLATGADFSLPYVPMVPTPSTSTAPWPSSGHGMSSFSPPKVYVGSAESVSAGSGSGRTACAIAKTIRSSRTSGVQILTRRTAVRTGVSGGGGVFVSSASRSSGGLGGMGCCRVRSASARPAPGAPGVPGLAATSGVTVGPTTGAGRTSSERSGTNLLVRSAGASGASVVPATLEAQEGFRSAAFPCSSPSSCSSAFGFALVGSFSAVVGWSSCSARGALKTAVG